MNSCDFRVFLQEFGTTVHLSLPGSVSEKERLLLKPDESPNDFGKNH